MDFFPLLSLLLFLFIYFSLVIAHDGFEWESYMHEAYVAFDTGATHV